MATELNSDKIREASNLLTQVLQEQVTNGRLTEGAALRDLVVKAFSAVYAQMQADNETSQTLRSLRTINQSDLSDLEKDAAIRAWASNWFITQNTGSFARGVISIRVTRKQDYLIPRTQRFRYNRTLAFYPDIPSTTDNVVISSRDILPEFNTDGTVRSYFFTLPVVAGKSGAEYNVAPATWLETGSFSPFVLSVFSSVKFSGGKSKETTQDIIDRSPTAVAVRNLINDRSIQAVLKNLNTELTYLDVVGYGDPEMQRDNSSLFDPFGLLPKFHVGGHYDVYMAMPRQERTFTGEVGAAFSRPDGVVSTFRDSTVTDWTTTDVAVGDVVRVVAGHEKVPRDYPVREVRESELRVSEKYPFAEAASNVSYYIYRPIAGPDVQIFPSTGTNATGRTTSSVIEPGAIVLPGGPQYVIRDVTVLDPDPGDPAINSGDGFLYLTYRINSTPTDSTDPSLQTYQVVTANPSEAQSAKALSYLKVPPRLEGKTVRVRYDTLAGFDTIDSYVRSRFERVLTGNPLPKAYHPVYLSFTIPYRLKKNASVTSIDELALRNALVEFVEGFSRADVLDISDLATAVRNFNSEIGSVFPFDIDYTVIGPDGNLYFGETKDVINVDALVDLGVSDNTVLYITDLSLVDVEAR